MSIYLVQNIFWDCKKPRQKDLPDTVIIIFEKDDNENVQVIGDKLSDYFGYCHNGYDVHRLTENDIIRNSYVRLNNVAIMYIK